MFILDRTLGRLNKWLRLLGFKTLFIKTVDDDKLITKTEGENGFIFLTRNMKVYNTIKDKKKCHIKNDDFRLQLKEVSCFFPHNWSQSLFSRCVTCGDILKTVDKNEIKEYIPEYIYEEKDDFKFCPNCDKVFWRGTHCERIISELQKIFPKLKR